MRVPPDASATPLCLEHETRSRQGNGPALLARQCHKTSPTRAHLWLVTPPTDGISLSPVATTYLPINMQHYSLIVN